LAIGVQFDFPSSPAGVALAQTGIELSAFRTHVLRRATVFQADEVILQIDNLRFNSITIKLLKLSIQKIFFYEYVFRKKINNLVTGN